MTDSAELAHDDDTDGVADDSANDEVITGSDEVNGDEQEGTIGDWGDDHTGTDTGSDVQDGTDDGSDAVVATG